MEVGMCANIPWDCINTITTCITVTIATILAALTYLNGVREYKRQSSQKRAELLANMRRRLREDNFFKCICDAIDGREEDIGDAKSGDIWNFIDFLEEIALLVNSKLMSKNLAYDMFGYYAICFSETYICDYTFCSSISFGCCNNNEECSITLFKHFIRNNDKKDIQLLFEYFVKNYDKKDMRLLREYSVKNYDKKDMRLLFEYFVKNNCEIKSNSLFGNFLKNMKEIEKKKKGNYKFKLSNYRH